MRGQVVELGEIKIFTFGGGESHDKAYRREGKNWWKQEMPSEAEMNEGIENLEKENFEVDYVVTHSAPTSIRPKYDPDPLTEYLEGIKSRLKYKKWYFGHYHIDKEIDDTHTAIFNQIKTIGD